MAFKRAITGEKKKETFNELVDELDAEKIVVDAALASKETPAGAATQIADHAALPDVHHPETHDIAGVKHNVATLAELSSKISDDTLAGLVVAQELSNKTLDVTAAKADGTVLGAIGVRFDAYLRDIKELRGFGGSAGKAVRIVSTYAELEAACEDASVYWVLCLEGTYTGSTTIAPTSYTHIIGIGNTIFDWNGASGGYMFQNASATYVVLENIEFAKTVNYCIELRAGWQLLNSYGVLYLLSTVGGDDETLIQNCELDCYLSIHGFGCRFINSTFKQQMILYIRSATTESHYRLIGCDFISKGELVFWTQAGYTNEAGVEATDCHFLPTATVSKCVRIYNAGAGAATLSNLKFNHCTFRPRSTSYPCISVDTDVDLVLNDFHVHHCTFKDAASAYEIPAGTQNRWRLNNNDYHDAVTTVYNFTGGTQNNFVYTNDGP